MAVLSEMPASAPDTQYSWPARLEQRIRAIPIRWRIFAIAILNTTVVLLLARSDLGRRPRADRRAWNELRAARQSDRLLVSLDSESVRLQSLIHRYFNQPQPDLLTEIEARRQKLLDLLRTRAALEPGFAGIGRRPHQRDRALPRRLRRTAPACATTISPHL